MTEFELDQVILLVGGRRVDLDPESAVLVDFGPTWRVYGVLASPVPLLYPGRYEAQFTLPYAGARRGRGTVEVALWPPPTGGDFVLQGTGLLSPLDGVSDGG